MICDDYDRKLCIVIVNQQVEYGDPCNNVDVTRRFENYLRTINYYEIGTGILVNN